MAIDVTVPVLAESIPDATLLDWRKQPGDRVEQDEILIELETDKNRAGRFRPPRRVSWPRC